MNPTTAKRLASLAAATSLGIAAACSSSSTTGATAGTGAAPNTATGATTGAATPAGTTVTVQMTEWTLTPSAASAPAGTITFTATNSGSLVHELALFKTDLDPAKLPLDEEGAVDERAAGVELMDEVEDVKPGQSKSFTIHDAQPGNYVLVCNLVDKDVKHYEHKMYEPFKVT